MQWKPILRLCGYFAFLETVVVTLCAFVSLLYHDGDVHSLFESALILLLIGAALVVATAGKTLEELTHRDATFVIILSWTIVTLLGAIPFFMSGLFGPLTPANFLNSFFESMAGFATAGASVLGDPISLETLSHGLLLWRAFTHWIGGVGIIVFSLVLLPFIRTGGMELYQAGAFTREKLKMRFVETFKIILMIYTGLTALEILCLWLGKMSLFDAICHSFATIATGGFSTKNNSIEYYHSPYLEIVCVVFMVLSASNFTLHYRFLKGNFLAYFQSVEWRFFISVLLIATGLVYINLRVAGTQESLRHALFNVVSIATTTGFSSTDFNAWPSFSKSVLVTLMFIGGCAGSTAGAIKCFRIYLLVKYAYRRIFRIIHPMGFTPVKFEGRVVDRDVLEGITAFFFLYLLVFSLGTLVLTFQGLDPISSISAVATCQGGVGPGLGSVGPYSNYYHLPALSKLTLCLCMLIGRVDVFPFLAILTREFWKK